MYYLIITEANQKVATGHFMEVVELSTELKKRGHFVKVLVNDECPRGLLKKLSCDYSEYKKSVAEDKISVIEKINKEHPDVIITNIREIQNEDIISIKSVFKKPIICIDEFGNRTLDADIIINPMVDSFFWNYPNSSGKVYVGHKYLVLPESIKTYHDKEKKIRREISRVCVSMGGVDLKGTTLNIVKWLPQLFERVTVEVILGAGFGFYEELEEEIKKMPQTIVVNVNRNVSNIYDFFYESDLAFCAGGNTLHELACIGTPAIVIPTNPHEENNGKEFEKMGAAFCLNNADLVKSEEVDKALNKLVNEKRNEMSKCGKRFIDGDGVHKVVSICEKKHNRLGVFTMYSEDGVVDDFIYFLLDKMLEEVLSDIIIVSNGPIQDRYYKELKKRTTSIYLREDRGFDGGAYRDLFLNICSNRKWEFYDEIVLFNDSFYGPIYSMKQTFEMMEKKNYDFWGMLYCKFDNEETYKYGLNAFFIVFSSAVTNDVSFLEYWNEMKEETYYGEPGSFERTITKFFENRGFSHGSVLNESGWEESVFEREPSWVNDTKDMLDKYSLPVLKCRALTLFRYRDMEDVLEYLRSNTCYDVGLIEKHREHLAKNNRLGGYTVRQIEEFVNQHERIFVYGHGKHGKGMAVLFEEKKWTISGYVVSKDASDDEININELELMANDGVIVALGMVAIQEAMDNIKKIPENQLLMYGHRSL